MSAMAQISKRMSLLVLVLAGVAVGQASALPLLDNGGFEVGFTAWTRADALGSDGTFSLQSGTASPTNLVPVPAPPDGVSAAMTDAQGPGSHVLYQDFVVPVSAISAVLTFELFIGNRAVDFFTPFPASLDFSTPALNQQARVDILLAGSDPFSVSGADILQSLVQTQSGDALIAGYTSYSADITALLATSAGQTLRLRFAETDNVDMFQFGVDNVNLAVQTVPEPATGLLLALGCVGLLGYGWRKRRTA